MRLVSAPGVSRLMQVIRRPLEKGLDQIAVVIVLLHPRGTDPVGVTRRYAPRVPEIMEVRDVLALIRPAVVAMLHGREAASLHPFLIETGDTTCTPLLDDDVVLQNSAMARWAILGEDGGSGSLPIEDGEAGLVAGVQSDLQDFIAESSFAWGELRAVPDDERTGTTVRAAPRLA